MDDKQSNDVDGAVGKSSSTSESSEYELVENNQQQDPANPIVSNNVSEELINDAIESSGLNSPTAAANMMVGKSIFYDCNDRTNSDTDDEDAPTYEIDGDCKNEGNFTIFSNVVYLGSANLNVPKSESEILRHINELNTSTSGNHGVKIKISIPNSSDGAIVLYDEESDTIYSSFDIQSILFYARGAKDSSDQACFAFSWSHGDTKDAVIYQCHIFRCNIPEAVNHVSQCFSKAFQRIPSSMACSIASENFAMNSITSDILGNPLTSAMYEFLVGVEIREKEKSSKNTYTNVLREKSCFKIHQLCDKEICITVKQVASDNLPPLYIERCFGVLLSVGKIKKQADMLLLELATPGSYLKSSPDFQIIAKWDLTEKAFEALNESSQRTHLITLAVDLVIKGIQEPVRFVIETHMKIDNAETQSSRFGNNFLFQQGSRRPLMRKFYIQLKENGDNTWVLSSVDPSDESLEPVQSNSFNQKFKNLSKIVRSASVSADFDDLSPDEITETDLDEDEPLASGTGEVNKDCSQDRLDSWSNVLIEWVQTTPKRPKNLATLIRNEGIPESLRCQIWQKLAKIEERPELSDDYRILITKESKCEDVILRDVYRTFPAHEKFRENGGVGQDALYKVSRAYSVYDTEIGYCQGLSFIAATLLLHMPEEEAYQVLVAIMYDFGLRELYKQNFENLQLRLFQLACMIRDQLPDLFEHFTNQKLEVHMFASQWFLTLFTARFPLPFVFQCIDLFLLDGINVLFQIAFTLLNVCRKELLQKDFESILKYIRVQLPKKFRSEHQAAKFIRLASECKTKKLKKYEEEYLIQKEDNEKIERMLKQYQMKYDEDRKIMRGEIAQLQEQVKKYEGEKKKFESIINDYKQIIQRQEQEMEFQKNSKSNGNEAISTCDNNDISSLKQRIRELELDLARAKVAQVEAECQNQNLKHQLMTMTNKPPPQPQQNASNHSWKTKLIDSVVNSVQNANMNIPTFQSHINELTTQFAGADEPK